MMQASKNTRKRIIAENRSNGVRTDGMKQDETLIQGGENGNDVEE